MSLRIVNFCEDESFKAQSQTLLYSVLRIAVERFINHLGRHVGVSCKWTSRGRVKLFYQTWSQVIMLNTMKYSQVQIRQSAIQRDDTYSLLEWKDVLLKLLVPSAASDQGTDFTFVFLHSLAPCLFSSQTVASSSRLLRR